MKRSLMFFFLALTFLLPAKSQSSALWVGQSYTCDASSAVMGLTSDINWTYSGGGISLSGSGFYRNVTVTKYFAGTVTVKCSWKYRLYSGDSYKTQTKTWTFTCNDNPVSITPSSLKLNVGQSGYVGYSHKYTNQYSSYASVYFSTSSSCISVDKYTGKITALKAGTAYVNVYSNLSSVAPHCMVTVNDNVVQEVKDIEGIYNITSSHNTIPNPTKVYKDGFDMVITKKSDGYWITSLFDNDLIANNDGGFKLTKKSNGKYSVNLLENRILSIDSSTGYLYVMYVLDEATDDWVDTWELTFDGSGNVILQDFYVSAFSYNASDNKWHGSVDALYYDLYGKKGELKEIKVTEIQLNKTSNSLNIGETLQLVATVKPTDATNKSVTWSSSNTTVATVSSSGLVTAKSAGTATVTCKAADGSGKYATCSITVKEATVTVSSITLNKSSANIYEGETLQLSATVSPSNATDKSVTWSSSNTSIATVSSSGLVTAKSVGTATITCKAADGSGKYATCSITVKKSDFVYVNAEQTILSKYNGTAENVKIPDNVKVIEDNAFFGNSYMKSVEIPNSVTSIGIYAFGGCVNLERFIGKFASEDNRCLINDGDLIAFAPSGLTSYVIPNSVTSIGVGAFDDCSSLTSIKIPNSVTSIGDGAFYGCSSLISVEIPNSVTSIGLGAFGDCSNLTGLISLNTTPPLVEEYCFDNVPISTCILKVPANSVQAYKAANGWKEFKNIVGIGNDKVEDITGLEGTYYVTSGLETVSSPTKTYTDGFEMVVTKKSDGYWITSMFGEDLVENNDGGFKITNNGNGKLSADISYDNILSYNPSTGYLYAIYAWDEAVKDWADNWNLSLDASGNLTLEDFYVVAFIYDEDEEIWNGEIDALYYDMTGKKKAAPTTTDKMTLAAVTGKSGATVTLPISLTNEEVISGFQFSLLLPSGVTITDANMANRAGKLTPSYNLSNGVYKFSVLSLNGKTVSGNDGVVMNVDLNIASTVKEGDYIMTLKDVKLFAENGAEIAVADNSAKLTIKNVMLGDVNGNGEVNTNDAIAIVNHVIGKPQSEFIEEAADVNGNGEINTNDAIAIVNYVIGKSSSLNSKKHLGLAESILMEKIKKEKIINNNKTLK